MIAISASITALDWAALAVSLDRDGFALTKRILSDEACDELIAQFEQERLFRKKVIMAKHDYGRGVYQYFAYPLPLLVAELRESFFSHLSGIANEWQVKLGKDPRFPRDLSSYLTTCHQAGQKKSTPLMLRYGCGDFNRLHRDLYGELIFPIQVAILLNEPGQDFAGGEFVLVEHKPRSQSKVEVVPVGKGGAIIFAVSECPRRGVHGYRRVKLSHGVSRIRRGQRHTLGLIFHDAS